MTDDRLARVALSRLVEPGNLAVAAAVEERGPVAVWEALRTGVAARRVQRHERGRCRPRRRPRPAA
jgi:hypothetical protein